MIKPTVGRSIWYYPPGRLPYDQPQAAIITHVFSDRMVNLAIFHRNGNPIADPPTSITLVQDGDATPPASHGYCTWMPYQIEKADALKAEATAA